MVPEARPLRILKGVSISTNRRPQTAHYQGSVDFFVETSPIGMILKAVSISWSWKATSREYLKGVSIHVSIRPGTRH